MGIEKIIGSHFFGFYQMYFLGGGFIRLRV